MGLVIAGGTVSAQVLVRGVISEKENGAFIANAFVKNITQKTGTLSKDSGFYKIAAKPGDLLEFGKVGYELKTILCPEEPVLNIELTISTNVLDELVVSASKEAQSLKNTSVSIGVIKPYLIDNKNPKSAENTVDQIPGVQAVDGQVVIRSGSGWSYGAGSRVMVMVDGMPMLSGDAGQVQWTFLPVENIESIEVIKGASSVLFGSSALNGVINIRTAKPKTTAQTKLSTFSGFYNAPSRAGLDWSNRKILTTSGIRAFHSHKINKNSFALNLNLFNDDGYRMGDNDQRLKIGGKYQRDLHKVNGYAGININMQEGRSSSFLLWENSELGYTALDSNFTKNKVFRLNIDPFFVMIHKGWKQLVQGRFYKVSNRIENTVGPDQSNFSEAFFAEYQVSKSIFSSTRLIGGITGNYAKSRSPLYQGNQTATNASIYLQATTTVGKWNMDGGMRYEHYTLNAYKEGKPVIKAGISRELTKATFLRASYGQGYRFPTIAESYVLTSVGPLNIYPNNSLKSETGWNAEVGLKQGLKIKKMNALVDLAAFWMEYKRMMEFTFGIWEKPTFANPLPLGFKSINVSDARITGLDVSMAGSLKLKQGEWKWLLGYTYTKAISLQPDKVFLTDSVNQKLTYKNTSSDPNGNYLKYRPKHLVRMDIQYEFKGWEAGVSCRYNSYLQNIDIAFVSIPINLFVPGIQTMRDKGKRGDYVIDFRLGKSWGKWKILGLVNNVLNREYMTRPADLRPPRSFVLQVNRVF